jgi:hypothetical protein
MNRACFYILILLVAQAAGAGEGGKPRWMSPEQGFIVEDADARVESVTEDEETGVYRVEISVPTLESPIEEVVVIGHKEEKPELILPEIPWEIVNDLDANRSGIIIYLGEKREFSLRINYVDGSHAILPEKVGGIKP